MALSATDPNPTIVGTTLGETSRNVGVLCLSTKINKWAAHKPASIIAPGSAYLNGGLIKTHGLYRTSIGSIYYNRPQGGQEDPYRLGDFRLYDHLVGAPTQIIIKSVYEVNTRTKLTSPYVLFNGFSYIIELQAMIGEIAPGDILSGLYWTTSQGGGVAIVSRNAATLGVVSSDVVFSVPILLTEIPFTCDVSSGSPLKIIYIQTDEGVYRATAYTIEDDSYLELFSASVISLNIGSLNVRNLGFVGTIDITLTGTLTNSSGRDLTIARIRYGISTNSGTRVTSYDNYSTKLNDGEVISINKSFGQPSGIIQGSNTFSVIMYVEIHDSTTGQYTVIVQGNTSATITISLT